MQRHSTRRHLALLPAPEAAAGVRVRSGARLGLAALAGAGLLLTVACAAAPSGAAAERAGGAATTASAGAAAGATRLPLAERAGRALDVPALQGASLGALVVRRSDGAILFERSPDRPLVPASNLKLLTALAALSRFGPTHQFVTRVYSDAPPDAAGSVGWLAVQGGGDPSLTSEQWWRLAADLRLAGVRRVRGGLLLDDSRFDAQRWHPAWGDVSARAYHAPVGALSANYGAFTVEVAPGAAPGEPARVSLDPPVPYLQLENRVVTGPPGFHGSVSVERLAAPDAERVRVDGTLAVDAEPRVLYRSVADPTRYAGAVFGLQLASLGIAIESRPRVAPVPERAHLLLEFEGMSLAEIVRLLLKFSSNVISESVVKALGADVDGHPGSWQQGVHAVRAQLEALRLDTRGLALVDGSGLAYGNRVSARTLVDALRIGSASFAFGPEFVAALPIAAADGTLSERANGARGAVRAKTGLLTRVTGLSGYAETAQGVPVAFSVLVNGFRCDAETAMGAVDGFVEALVAP